MSDLSSEIPGSVLIIDDDKIVLDLIDALFDDQKIELFCAASGREGLDIALTKRPDLILLDIRMPEMDGYAVCKELKEIPETENIPVIFLTAKTDIEDELMGLDLGAIDYISKPIIPQIVEARIKNHLAQKKQRDHLEIMSAVDGLTDIANRRRFDEYLDQEWRRAVRNHYPLSLMMIDIDNFKAYNDSLGHLQGDQALRQVAREIQRFLRRPSDLVARYGGEEFSVIMPDTPPDAAVNLATRVRDGIEGINISHPSSDTADHVTISIGVNTLSPDENVTIEEFVSGADKNLYVAKAQGRNRVIGGS